jgi:hypothetical protein
LGHFCKVVDGKISQVIVAEPEFFDTFVDSSPGSWIQCSYNTRGGKHYGQDGQLSADQSKALRGNYPGIGYTYDQANDVFYAPQPFASWILDQTDWTWKAPVAMPEDGKAYKWDETTTSWIEVPTV